MLSQCEVQGADTVVLYVAMCVILAIATRPQKQVFSKENSKMHQQQCTLGTEQSLVQFDENGLTGGHRTRQRMITT